MYYSKANNYKGNSNFVKKVIYFTIIKRPSILTLNLRT